MRDSLWPPSFRAAIFDFDGTIADTAAIWKEVDLVFLGARGLPYSADYAKNLAHLGFEAGALYTKELFALPESVEDICAEWNRMGKALYETKVMLRPGVKAYIAALKKLGIRIGLATTNDKNVLEAMQLVDVHEIFDTQVYVREVQKPKNHPAIYLEAARRLDVKAADCIVFEDIVQGLRSAHAAGMVTCGVQSSDPLQNIKEVRAAADLWIEDWRTIAL